MTHILTNLWKITLFAVLCTNLLCGCAGGPSFPTAEELSREEEVRILAPDGQVLQVLADDAEMDAFLDTVLDNTWDPASLPADVQTLGRVALWQRETLKHGQSPQDREMVEVLGVIVYDRPYCTLETGGLVMTFRLPGETAEYLRGFFS